ncbi:MAG: hypothetical protein GYB31_05795 [Bacteroidetes bacterium]|nr:hypothetical protein [Bacteroidota bacterium]
MKRFIILSFLSIYLLGGLQAQELRTTYPIDSCLYFMDPHIFKVKQVNTLPNGNQGNTVVFQSAGSPDLLIMGKGRFVFEPNDLPAGITLDVNDTGHFLINFPEPATSGIDDWPGGQPPFPFFLFGFLEKIGNTTIDPPIPITLQVRQILIDNTTE